MANDPGTFYAQQFQSNLVLLAQQMEPRLPMAALQGNHAGAKQAVAIEQLGSTSTTRRTTRFEPVVLKAINHYRRWVYQDRYDDEIGFDTLDQMQMLQDPRGQYAVNQRAAYNRQMDLAMINAFFADANIGETGTSTASFDTTNNRVAVDFDAGAATGLTVAKLIEARRILKGYEVDLDYENCWCAINATQEADLLNDIKATSRDFTNGLVLQEGRIRNFLGTNFVHTEQLQIATSTYYGIPVWVPSGMHFGTWAPIEARSSIRDDLRGHPWQIAVSASFGAVRTEEHKVVQILSSH